MSRIWQADFNAMIMWRTFHRLWHFLCISALSHCANVDCVNSHAFVTHAAIMNCDTLHAFVTYCAIMVVTPCTCDSTAGNGWGKAAEDHLHLSAWAGVAVSRIANDYSKRPCQRLRLCFWRSVHSASTVASVKAYIVSSVKAYIVGGVIAIAFIVGSVKAYIVGSAIGTIMGSVIASMCNSFHCGQVDSLLCGKYDGFHCGQCDIACRKNWQCVCFVTAWFNATLTGSCVRVKMNIFLFIRYLFWLQ